MRITGVEAIPIRVGRPAPFKILIEERWEISEGRIAAPTGPGLGVTLDEAQLAKIRLD